MRLGNPSDSSSNSNKKPIINFTIFSENVVKEINKVRTNPLEYMGKLKKLAKINNEGELEFNGILIKLRENKKSFNEALDFLSKQEKVNKLTIKNGIIKSVEDLMKVLIIHDGIEKTQELASTNHFEKRMNKYGCAFGELDELIDIGCDSPELIVLKFIICDGNTLRSERKVLFNNRISYIGVTTEILPCEKYSTIVNLAENYYDAGEEIPDEILKIYRPEIFYKYDQEKKIKMMKIKEQHYIENNHNLHKNNYSTFKNSPNNYIMSPVTTNNNDHFKTYSHIPNDNSYFANQRSPGVINLKKSSQEEENHSNEEVSDQDEEEYNTRQDQDQFEEHEEREIDEINTKEMKNLNNLNKKEKNKSFSEDIEEIYDENILKVTVLEKKEIQEKTGLYRTLVKKCITYKDGSIQTIIFVKKN